MQPIDDHELNALLKQWEAPPAPASLQPPREDRLPLWRWLLTGSIRIPVPAGLAAMLILAVSVYWAIAARQVASHPVGTVTLADFEPVKQLQPRIIRSGYEAK
jgi:hypothetical protein